MYCLNYIKYTLFSDFFLIQHKNKGYDIIFVRTNSQII